MVANQVDPVVQQTADPRGPILAVIPAYNEDRFIASVVFKVRRYVDLVLVIDDASTDETAWLAETAGAKVIRQTVNRGKATGLNVGLCAARDIGALAVVLIDGDGQQNPSDIPAMLKPILDGQADIVIGSRFLGLPSNTPRWRIFGQQALTAATNLASGVALTDSQSGFRVISRRALEAFNFKTLGFSVESEMQFLIKAHNLTVREVPIIVNYDEKPKRNPFKHGFQVLNGILRMIGQNRPLFFFGVPGLIILAAGFFLGLHVVEVYSISQDLAIGTAMIAITLCIIGVFSIFTGLILHTIRSYMTD